MSEMAFMLSNWYSGATLLSILLNNHSKLVCNGETFPFQYDKSNSDIYVCSCGSHLRTCRFYKATCGSLKKNDGSWSEDFRIMPHVSNSMLGNKVLGNFGKYSWLRDLLLSQPLPLRSRLNNYLKAHQQFYENARNYKGATYYIDGTKSIRRAELFVKYSNNLRIKVINLVRDGRGFCWSYLKNKNLKTEQLREATYAWSEYINLVDIFTARYPVIEVKTIRYEDLCLNLAETLQDICQFLDIDFEQTMIGKPAEHHMLGNRMRSSFDGTVREDLLWKQNFSKRERYMIEKLLQEKLVRYAYL